MPTAVKLKLDPWASDLGAAIAIDDAVAAPPVDIGVESTRWTAVDPDARVGEALALVFIDGVRRVDARVIASRDGGGPVYGLLGSYAVGALRAGNGAPEMIALVSRRVLVLGDGAEHDPLLVPISGDGSSLAYIPISVPDTDLTAPLQGLQTEMRRAEDEMARSLADPGNGRSALPPGALIVADGPLAYLARTGTPLIGFIKSLHRSYLAPDDLALLPQLRPGQRTPIFAILDKNQRYSWYLRLGLGGPADHELAGIARLECGSDVGIEAAQAIADRSASTLVRCASTRERDPRSPQNLIPLGGLEKLLRHRLGDSTLIRRAITAHLSRQETP